MNQKFRKKPVVIEAFQLTRERLDVLHTASSAPGHELPNDWPAWLVAAWHSDARPGSLYYSTTTGNVLISTLEGGLHAAVNDWVIRGVQGEIYPCKPAIFAATYEEVCDEQACGTGCCR